MNVGLAVFVLVVAVNVLGLLLDRVLSVEGATTVTDLVRRGDWVIGALIIAWQVVGIAGLAYHFWGE